MVCEAHRGRYGIPADPTDGRVGLHVVPQVPPPAEGLAADLAAVGRGLGVFGWAGLGRALGAVGVAPLQEAPLTAYLLTVDLTVAPQSAGSGEALAADATAVRLHPRVAPHVHVHVLEGSAADPAGSAGVPVGLQVGQQSLGGGQLLSTHPTGAGGGAAVRLGVLPQEPPAVEGVPANPAEPPLLTLVGDLQSSASLLVAMDTQVLQEKLMVSEGQSTDRAGPLAVGLPVAPERSGPGEAPPTHAADERLVSAVAPHVRLHVLERLPADLTRPPHAAASMLLPACLFISGDVFVIQRRA